MNYKRISIFIAVLLLAGSLGACSGSATVVRLELPPQEQPLAGIQQPSFIDTVQDVAEQMLPGADETDLSLQEATPTDARPFTGPDLQAPMVALTFDDGPMQGSTGRILDILEQNGAKATFFVQGKQVALYPELVQRAYDMGCQIGNHTYNHKDLTSLNDRDALGQLESVNSLVEELTGEGCALVRPPHGKGWRDSRVLNLVPYPLILWSIDTNDWSTLNPQKTISSVLDSVKDGDIVLMHDIYDETAEAAAVIIPELIARGYNLVTVSEMFNYKGLELSAGNAYRQAG